MKKITNNPVFYFIFRLLVGLLFFMHGAQKLLGWFSDNEPVAFMSLMGLAGIIELVGGLAIVLGIFTRPVAFIGALEMLVAYFMVHAPNGANPLLNKGELALLYFAAFLVLATQGAGKFALFDRSKA